jgi:predicted RNA-binding Zn-ribbon protein involved in translation (DUF1610 family)
MLSEEPKIRRVSVSKGRIKYCPTCLSKLKPVLGLHGWLLPQEYECPVCGYRGPIGLEKEE